MYPHGEGHQNISSSSSSSSSKNSDEPAETKRESLGKAKVKQRKSKVKQGCFEVTQGFGSVKSVELLHFSR